MDEQELAQNLAEELTKGWEIVPTGQGYLIVSDWQWPNRERIEIHVHMVGDREDLYLVSDGGDLLSFLFSHGIDLTQDTHSMKILEEVASNYGARVADFQLVKGAKPFDLPQSVRLMVEAIKDASYLLWHKLGPEDPVH